MDIEGAAQAIRDKASGKSGLGATVRFDCGEEGVIFLDAVDSPVAVEVADKQADCSISCDLATLESLLSGDLSPTVAFAQGRIRIEGDMGAAMRLSSIL